MADERCGPMGIFEGYGDFDKEPAITKPIAPDALIGNLIDAVRQDEAQCHFGTAGGRARARTDLQDATKDIRETLEANNRQLILCREALWEAKDLLARSGYSTVEIDKALASIEGVGE